MAPFSKKQASISNRGEQPVQFRHKDAQRIANVVHQVETARRGRNPSYLPRAAGAGGGGGGAVEVASFTGNWLKNCFKAITLAADTASQPLAVNLTRNVYVNPVNGPRVCLVAQAVTAAGGSSTYVLIDAEC